MRGDGKHVAALEDLELRFAGAAALPLGSAFSPCDRHGAASVVVLEVDAENRHSFRATIRHTRRYVPGRPATRRKVMYAEKKEAKLTWHSRRFAKLTQPTYPLAGRL
jgi:hypothetical protein